MDNTNPYDTSDLGSNMVLSFRYIQQIFKETAQLMRKLDSLMGKDWTPTYGNRTTRDVTSHIEDPEYWLVQASFRIYDSAHEPSIKKGITVVYWSEDTEEPILIAGKLDYVLNPTTGRPNNHYHWDLWDAWYYIEEEKTISGTIYHREYQGENDYLKEAYTLAIPLVTIQSEDDIRTRIYDRLITL